MFAPLVVLFLVSVHGVNSAIPTTGDLRFICSPTPPGCNQITIEYGWECPYTEVLCNELSLTMQFYLTSSKLDVEYSLLMVPGTILGHRNYTFTQYQGDKYRGKPTMIASGNRMKPKYIVFLVEIHNNGVVIHRNLAQVCTVSWNKGTSQMPSCTSAADFEDKANDSRQKANSPNKTLVIILSVCIPVAFLIVVIVTVLCCLRRRKLRQRKQERGNATTQADITFVNTQPPENSPPVRQIARCAGRATTTAVPAVRYSKQTNRLHHSMLATGTSCANPSYDTGTSKRPPSYDQVAENGDDELYQNHSVF